MAVHCIHPATTKTSVVFVIRIINCRTQLTMQIVNQHALLCLLLAAVRAVPQALVAFPMDKSNVRVAIPTIIWMGLFVKHAALVLVQVGNTSVNNVRRLKIEYAAINNVLVTMALQKWVNFVQPTMPPNVNHRCMLWLDSYHQTWMNQLF
jgi:hypothetical protein